MLADTLSAAKKRQPYSTERRTASSRGGRSLIACSHFLAARCVFVCGPPYMAIVVSCDVVANDVKAGNVARLLTTIRDVYISEPNPLFTRYSSSIYDTTQRYVPPRQYHHGTAR